MPRPRPDQSWAAGLPGRVVSALGATAAVGAANVVAGRWLLSSPRLGRWETDLVRAAQSRRSPASDAVAKVASTLSDVPATVAHGLLATALLHRRTGSPRVAALPLLALSLEASMYVVAGALVDRPRPAVPRLDHDQPTSSFPSGHQGATVALAVVYWHLAAPLRPWRRRALRTACVAAPALLAWSRVYVGMHFPSDVVAGTVNGLATGALARDTLAGPERAGRLRPPRRSTKVRGGACVSGGRNGTLDWHSQ